MTDPRPVAVLSVHACPFSEVGAAENGGMSVYIREVTRALGRLGVKTVIFTRLDDPASPPELPLPEGCRLVHIEAGPRGPVDKDALFYHLPEFMREVAAYARRENLSFRSVHSHYWLSGWVGKRLGNLWGVPWLHMAHTLGKVKDRDRPPGATTESAQRVAVEEEILRDCNRLIAPTAQEVEDLALLYGAERECVSVISPGVDTELFQPQPCDDLRAELGIAADEKVVIFIGRLERLKGVETLIHAFAGLLEDRPSRKLRLLVLGDDSSDGHNQAAAYGGERARMVALTRYLGIEERVNFLGVAGHDRLPCYYSLADVCSVPSYSESFGLVALEAQACGTPVVASRIGGLRQLVIDGISGFTIPSHDPRAHTAALGRVLDDDDLRDRMGAAGRSIARAYSWEATAARLLSAYEEAERRYDEEAAFLLG